MSVKFHHVGADVRIAKLYSKRRSAPAYKRLANGGSYSLRARFPRMYLPTRAATRPDLNRLKTGNARKGLCIALRYDLLAQSDPRYKLMSTYDDVHRVRAFLIGNVPHDLDA